MKTPLALVGMAVAAWAQQSAPNLPPPFQTPSVNNRPTVIERPDGARLRLPEGFNIEEYAAGFKIPRYMILGPGKELLVSDSVPKTGVVYVLTKNGKERKSLIENLNRPFGMAFWKDYLYVGEVDSVKRYKYDRKAMTVGPGEEVVSLKERPKAIGRATSCSTARARSSICRWAPGPMSVPANPRSGPPSAATIRTAADARSSPPEPATPSAWPGIPAPMTSGPTVQERDLIGDDLVPDYFTRIQPGGFYGWPYAYIGPNEDPRNKGQRPDLVAKTIVPDVVLKPAHVAVLDSRFYTGASFPEEISWRRVPGAAWLLEQVGARRLLGGLCAVQGRQACRAAWRISLPVGCSRRISKRSGAAPWASSQLPDGSLLVSDDGGNKIWRISYKK